MRPRLCADVRYAKSPDGVYVQGFAGACTLTGEHSYAWLDRLAPYLDGEHTMADLVAPLSAAQRALVETVVGALFDQRLLVDAAEDLPHSLSDEEQRCYEAEIAFIRYRSGSAEHRFERLRSARIAVAGSGQVVPALLESGLRCGWRQVRLRVPAGEVDAIRAVAREAVRDAAQNVVVETAGPDPAVPEADLVLSVFGQAGDPAAASPPGDAAIGQVLVGDTEAWVTAVGSPSRVAAESCWRRLAGHRRADAATHEELLTGPVPGVIASHLVLSCFSYLTGLAGEPAEPALVRIDLRDLTADSHRPVPYARPVVPDAVPDAVVDGSGERFARLVDERVGVLGTLAEDDLPQVPLAVFRASVSDPESVLPSWAPAPVVTGWSADRDQARLRARLAALATYASLVDPGGVRTDLLTGRSCTVPAARPRVPYHAPVGVAAGRTLADAVTAGLRAHCEALLAERADLAGRATDARNVVQDVGDDEAARLLALLHAAGRQVDVADLSGVLGVPAFAVRAGTGRPVLACAAEAAEALCDGLERAVLHWQCGGAVDTEPARWAVEPATPSPGAPADDPRCRALADALRAAGRAPVVVPLAVDEEVHGLAPHLVRVEAGDE